MYERTWNSFAGIIGRATIDDDDDFGQGYAYRCQQNSNFSSEFSYHSTLILLEIFGLKSMKVMIQ